VDYFENKMVNFFFCRFLFVFLHSISILCGRACELEYEFKYTQSVKDYEENPFARAPAVGDGKRLRRRDRNQRPVI
jgi:hypothetical protein